VRQVDSTHSIDVDNHYFELVANADNRLDVWDPVLGKFTDVNHSVFPGEDLNERSERHDSNNTTGVLVTNLNILGQGVDCRFGLLGVLTVGRSNDDCTVVLNVDRYTELVDHSANYRSTRTDDCTDLVGRNLERKHSRSVLAKVATRCGNRCFHIVENLQSGDTSLLERLPHDLERDSLYLNVHLQCGHALACARYLEVHISRVVFSTLNVGENGVVVDVFFVGNQSHGDTGYWSRNRNTTVHHRQRAGTDRSHRCRTVRSECFGDESNRVREISLARNNGLKRSFCQSTVTDLTPTGESESTSFTYRVRREVVVVDKVLFGFGTVSV
jgi:hypothetical protein